MEFLLIMGIGAVLAVLIVIGSRPKRPTVFKGRASPARQFSPSATPPWKKDIAASHPIGELQYLEGVERHDNDPEHQPFPLPPPRENNRD
ncbi:MAG TPA: hypothetical protein VHD62_00795 [Opitutaceae bacterium]|nr:hypothetical protein [Opitutaceae bacterium]HVT55570.1 hypothetical protein [Xanthobacteraceae bacterium]